MIMILYIGLGASALQQSLYIAASAATNLRITVVLIVSNGSYRRRRCDDYYNCYGIITALLLLVW